MLDNDFLSNKDTKNLRQFGYRETLKTKNVVAKPPHFKLIYYENFCMSTISFLSSKIEITIH